MRQELSDGAQMPELQQEWKPQAPGPGPARQSHYFLDTITALAGETEHPQKALGPEAAYITGPRITLQEARHPPTGDRLGWGSPGARAPQAPSSVLEGAVPGGWRAGPPTT